MKKTKRKLYFRLDTIRILTLPQLSDIAGGTSIPLTGCAGCVPCKGFPNTTEEEH